MRHRLAAFLVLGICLSDSRPAAAQSWPMYQVNPSHTGYMPVSLEPGQFYVRWSKGIGVTPAETTPSTLWPQGTAGSTPRSRIRFNDVTQLFALRTTDGSTLWSKGFGDIFSVNPPAYVNGIVYLQTCNHSTDTWLWALDGGSGARLFQVPLTAQWERYYAPTVSSGRVYVNGGYYGGMYGFNGSNGNQVLVRQRSLTASTSGRPRSTGSRAYTYLAALTMHPVSTSRSSWTVRTATAGRASSPIRSSSGMARSMHQVAGSIGGAGENPCHRPSGRESSPAA